MLCNNLLPLKTAGVSPSNYKAAVTLFWEHLLALAVGGRLRHESAKTLENPRQRLNLVITNISRMLQRFVMRQSFSQDALGGGRESNAQLLLVLLQLASSEAQECSREDVSDLAAVVERHSNRFDPPGMASQSEGRGRPNVNLSEMPDILVTAILLQPLDQWQKSRRCMLLHSIRFIAAKLQKAAPASSVAGTGADLEYADIAPMLKYFSLVDWIQRWSKQSLQDWRSVFEQRLQDLPAMVDAASELLEVLGKLEDCADLTSLMKEMRVVSDVLSQGTVAYNDFLNQACSGLQAALT